MGRIIPQTKGRCDYWPNDPRPTRHDYDMAASPLMRNTQDWRVIKFAELERGAAPSHHGMYRPACPRCPTSQFCLAARVSFAAFDMTKSQAEKFERFHDMTDIQREAPDFQDPDLFALYEKYVPTRHGDAKTEMQTYSQGDLKNVFGKSAWVYKARDKDGALVAASVIDQLGKDFCAEYQIYDPALAKTSPGIGMTLSLIHLMKKEHPDGHLYVGSWSPGSPKLGYKSQFVGTEVYKDGGWSLIAH
jgi:arginine-tRNA-protein transferase